MGKRNCILGDARQCSESVEGDGEWLLGGRGEKKRKNRENTKEEIDKRYERQLENEQTTRRKRE